MKISKVIVQHGDHENNEHVIIQNESYKKNENHRSPYENNENHEIIIIRFKKYENNRNLIIP